ncbi:MAG: glycosyltransferase [Pseudolysinimonas sp.]
MTRASILVPTHNRPGTLSLSVASALAQTVDDLEVIIIGDGVTPEVREMAHQLAQDDERVVFLDLPKGEHHGEVHRDAAIRAARSDAIFYLCDDDLLLPEHVADLLDLLDNGHTFVQSLNGWIDLDGAVHRHAGSLGNSRSVEWVMEPRWHFNFISLTGTAHSRRFYEQVGRPWSTTPAGDWPDRHQWRKMLDQPGFSGATSPRMTALQFPAAEPTRLEITDEQKLEELTRWAELIRQPDAQHRIDLLVADGTEAELAHYTLTLVATHVHAQETARELERALTAERAQASELAELRQVRDDLTLELTQVRDDLTLELQKAAITEQALTSQLAGLRQWREELLKTVSWRITRPLRAIRRRF